MAAALGFPLWACASDSDSPESDPDRQDAVAGDARAVDADSPPGDARPPGDAAPDVEGPPDGDAEAPPIDAHLTPHRDADAPPPVDAGPPAPDAEPPADGGALPPGQVRFVLSVSNDVPESIYVQLNDALGQPAWVTARRGAQRVWLHERCDLPDCDVPDGVCGIAETRVRDITGGDSTGRIELVWDGIWSEIPDDGGGGEHCERRVPAPPGDYTATFCFGLQAELLPDSGDPVESASGTVLNPACVDVPFRLPDDREVSWGLFGG